MKKEDGDFTIGGGCPDKRFTLTWMLVKLVYAAAWLSDPRGRKD